MRRSIYDEDHEAFRASVAEFLDRQVKPHLEEHIEQHAMPRELWLEAGKQGFLGLEIPEQYGGSDAGDYRFNAVLTEELAKVNMALPSCVGIHADIVAPYLVHLVSIGAARDPSVAEAADALYDRLVAAGVSVLYDDRDESPGVKLTDAELLGMPTIATVSPRSLAAGGAEVTDRASGDRSVRPLDDVALELGA